MLVGVWKTWTGVEIPFLVHCTPALFGDKCCREAPPPIISALSLVIGMSTFAKTTVP